MRSRIPAFDSIAFNISTSSYTPYSNPLYGLPDQSLLIISPDIFMPALEPLILHKNKSGMPTIAVSIPELEAYFGGIDTPEKIKRGIRYAYENLRIRYVMLVGDAYRVPVRYMFYHCLSKPYSDDPSKTVPTDGNYIASDLYYSNLYHHEKIIGWGSGFKPRFENWDANRNGLSNEGWWAPEEPKGKYDTITDTNPDNVDGYPDVAVGRIPAYTVTDVSSYVNKIISYESSPTRYQAHRKCKFTFVEDNNYASGGLTPGIISDSDLMEFPLITTKFLMIANDLNPELKTGGFDWKNASPENVADYASQSDWVSYIGHGSNKQWGYSGNVFSDSHVKLTASSDALPVVFAGACNTGEFIKDSPWNDEYVDVSGKRHKFVIPSSTDDHIQDSVTGEKFKLDSSNNCLSKPVILPKPNSYDFDRGLIGDKGFAHPWLIGNAPGGAIAYFGEIGTAPDTMAVELETYMFQTYRYEYNPILGIYF